MMTAMLVEEKAFQDFEKINSLPTVEGKHRGWLKQYEKKFFSIGENKQDCILWSKEKEKYIYSDKRFNEPILCLDGKYRAQPNKIQRHNRIFVCESDSEEASKFTERAKKKLESYGIGFIESSHGGKSNYLWIESNRDLTDDEVKKAIVWIMGEDSTADLNFSNSNFRLPVLFSLHWKYNNRELPLTFYEGKKFDFDSLGVGKVKVKKKTSQRQEGEYEVSFYEGNTSKKETKERFNVLSLEDLENYELPEYEWRVNHLIQDKQISIVAGSSATCKSWWCLNLAVCVSLGLPFLKNFQTEQGAVLFIDRENSLDVLKKRVSMICNGLGIVERKDVPLFFVSEQNVRFDNPQGRESLEEIIREKKIVLIIVDTYRRVISYEENNADMVSEFFDAGIKPICNNTGASFLFIHHHKKGSAQGDEKELLRGSSDFVNFVDSVVQISRRDKRLSIKQTKQRFGKELEPFDCTIETDEEEFFRFQYEGEKEDYSAMSRAVEVILQWIARNKKETFETGKKSELFMECSSKGIKKMSFSSAISELVKLGEIEMLQKGIYKPKSRDSEIVHSPPYKGGGLSGLSHTDNPDNLISPDGLSGLSGLTQHPESQKKTSKSPKEVRSEKIW